MHRQGSCGQPAGRPSTRGSLPARALVVLLAVSLLHVGPACARAKPHGADAERAAQDKTSRWQVRVVEVSEAGPYLDARIFGRSVVGRREGERRFFFPSTDACRAALVEGGEAIDRAIGPFGKLKGLAGDRCDPVGVASLPQWRDGRPWRRDPVPTPRDHAQYHAVFQDERLLMVRGRFPLALEMRWPEPMDSVAILPSSDVCRIAYEQGQATMEYHGSGPDVFVLEVDEGQCPIVGFAMPTEETP